MSVELKGIREWMYAFLLLMPPSMDAADLSPAPEKDTAWPPAAPAARRAPGCWCACTCGCPAPWPLAVRRSFLPMSIRLLYTCACTADLAPTLRCGAPPPPLATMMLVVVVIDADVADDRPPASSPRALLVLVLVLLKDAHDAMMNPGDEHPLPAALPACATRGADGIDGIDGIAPSVPSPPARAAAGAEQVDLTFRK